MAGPSIMVRILGDLTGLQKSVGDSGKSAEGAASKIHGAFSTVLGQLNSTGVLGPFGESLATVDEAFSKIAEHGKDVGQAMIGVGGALAGVGLGLQALGSKDQAAHQQLQAAVEATGKSYDDYEKKIESAIKSQENFGHSASETQDALRILTTATNDPAKALQYLGEASDIAAAKHESLGQAATDLGKVYNGNTKLLKEFGIVIAKQPNYSKAAASAAKQEQAATDNLAHAKRTLADIEEEDAGKKKLTVGQAIQLRNAEEAVTTATEKAKTAHQNLANAQDQAKKSAGQQTDAVALLGTKLKGQAAAAADTFTGKIDALKTKFEDSAATIGQKYGPAITAAGAGMSVLGTVTTTATAIVTKITEAQKAAKAAQEAATAATEAGTVATDAATVSEYAGLAPILLIIAAFAALGIAAYVIYRNWKTIWGFMKAIVVDVWNWIKTNWPLLLAILLGPIGVAADLIIKHWKDIKQGFSDALAAIKTAWGVFVGWLTGLAGAIARIATGMWHGISDAFGTATGAVTTAWNSIWSWFTGLPGAIGRVAGGMWDGIANAFIDAINWIIRAWDSLKFKVPSISVFGHKIGGETIGVPSIPQLPHLAQGGLITSTGVVYAHAGEVISPAPQSARGGPAVVLQGAVFNSAVDVDLFMRKAAWIVQTQRI